MVEMSTLVRCVLAKSLEHQVDDRARKWESSRIIENFQCCHERFDWLYHKVLVNLKNFQERKICEFFEKTILK